MSVYSLIVCDRCGAERRCHHAATPRVEARIAHWVTLTMPGRTEDLCPVCDAEVDW